MTPPSLLFKPVWTCSTGSSRHTRPATFLSSTGTTTGKNVWSDAGLIPQNPFEDEFICFCTQIHIRVHVLPQRQQRRTVPTPAVQLFPWLPPRGLCEHYKPFYISKQRWGVSAALSRARQRWAPRKHRHRQRPTHSRPFVPGCLQRSSSAWPWPAVCSSSSSLFSSPSSVGRVSPSETGGTTTWETKKLVRRPDRSSSHWDPQGSICTMAVAAWTMMNSELCACDICPGPKSLKIMGAYRWLVFFLFVFLWVFRLKAVLECLDHAGEI